MKYYTYAHKEIAVTSINAYLKVCKANGTRYASIQDETGKKVAWVNSQFGLKDKFFFEATESNVDNYGWGVAEVIMDKVLTPAEREGNGQFDRGIFTVSSYIVKNFGEIDHYREVKIRFTNGKTGGFEHIVLKNGWVIGVSKDNRVSNIDGSYADGYKTLLSCHRNGEDKVDLVLRYSPNGRFIRKANGAVVGLTGGDNYSMHQMEDEIIDATIFQH